MSFEARCPQCVFVSRQLGQSTPCLLHVSLPAATDELVTAPDVVSACPESDDRHATSRADYDEPYTFGQLRLTVDRPGPFSLREYVRLRLLRSRIQEQPSPLDTAPSAHVSGGSRR